MKILWLLFFNALVGTHITALATSRFQHQYQDLQDELRAAFENEITRAETTPLTIKDQTQQEYQGGKKASTAEKGCTLPRLKNSSILDIVKDLTETYKRVVSENINNCGFYKRPGGLFHVVANMVEECIDRAPDPKSAQKMIKQFRFYADMINAFAEVAVSTGALHIPPTCTSKTTPHSSARARVLNRKAWMAFLQNYQKAAAMKTMD